jgi:hypothetical protein
MRAQPSPQVGQHIPELIPCSSMIAPRHHPLGNVEPEDQRDRVIRAQLPLQVWQHSSEVVPKGFISERDLNLGRP